ncbi:hypothetical protein ACTVMP_22325 [Serratia marcescens]|uniref:hypothetical protein n=1 Tax=Serratia marcescens TaxID=615 RepID=UPI003FA69C63
MIKKQILLCGLWLVYSLSPLHAYGYDLTNLEELQPEGPMHGYVDWVYDHGGIIVRDVVLSGGDRLNWYGGACTQGGGSCIWVRAKAGGKYVDYHLETPVCIPDAGPGLVSDAANRVAREHLRGTMTKVGESDAPGLTGFTIIFIRVCNHDGNGLYYETHGGVGTSLICAVELPGEVDFPALSYNDERIINGYVRCSGEGSALVRVTVLGSDVEEIAPGVTIWTRTENSPASVNGDSVPVPVRLSVGAKNNSGEPGVYNGYFIYAVDYD